MDRLTRRQLKKDRFAEEVGHTVEYLGEHRKQAARYATIGLAVVLVAAGAYYYSKWQTGKRAAALAAAMQTQEAVVSPSETNPAVKSFPTEEAKNQAVVTAFSELAGKYSGTKEGMIARYFLGAMAAEQGKLDEAEKALKEVAAYKKDEGYASLAQFALAQVYRAQGKTADAEKLLRALVAKPTVFVSKAQATLELARTIAPTRPNEARKLLEPLRLEAGATARAAFAILNTLPKES